MKQYKKPVIVSEQVIEKVALNCIDYMYYAKDYEGCREEYIGRGKIDLNGCADLSS